MFGHGSPVEAHAHFGLASPAKRPDLRGRLHTYNAHYDSSSLQVKSKEVNGRLVLEGPLRVHWGVHQPIQFREKEEEEAAPPAGKEFRRSYCMAISNGLDHDFLSLLDGGGETLKGRRSSLEDLIAQMKQLDAPEDGPEPPEPGAAEAGTAEGDRTQADRPEGKPVELRRYNTVSYRGDQGERRIKRRKRSSRRLSMINGHVFHSDTSIFIPSQGSVTNVTISSLDSTPTVIQQLLTKFKVENSPDDYCLCVVKRSGETRVLGEADCPLEQRVLLGPLEEEAKIFIREAAKVQPISEEVAPFVNLPDAVLEGFLSKYAEEMEAEVAALHLKYRRLREAFEKRLSEISTQM